MYEVMMPKLSDSMAEGKIIKWRVQEGDEVHEGDVLAEIESDKAVMELECFHDGVLAKIVQGDDAEVPVGEVIALIARKGEEAEEPTVERKPEPRPEVEAAPVALKERAETKAVPVPAPSGERVAISPYAKKLALGKGIDYAGITGTGPGGRIVARDIELAVAAEAPRPEQPAREPAPSAKPPKLVKPSADEELPPLEVTEDEADIEEAPYRLKTLARRTTASKHVIPHFYVTRGADVTGLLERKGELKEEYGASVTHIVMLACLSVLKQHPEVNRSYDHGRIIKWKGINLGLAVQTDEGLTVAVLPNAQDLSLKEIVERSGPLVERAREGKLSAEDRRHPTFTISNLGMFDVEHFQPIINPPSSITLAVASALPAPVVRDDAIYIAKVMRLTLSCDHRIIDGVMAARFLKDLKDVLEQPERLLDQP